MDQQEQCTWPVGDCLCHPPNRGGGVMAKATSDRLRALLKGWDSPNEILPVIVEAAQQLDDLVAALRWCLEHDGQCLGNDRRKLGRARAAIAKATGEAA